MHGKSLADLETDWALEHKVTRALEIMGEASNRISALGKGTFPELPWRDMKNVRNRIVHQYFDLNYKIIFLITRQELPTLKEQIERVLTTIRQRQDRRMLLAKHDKPVLLKKLRQSRKKGLGL
jgi:uncharacterized protein with HEPN domain